MENSAHKNAELFAKIIAVLVFVVFVTPIMVQVVEGLVPIVKDVLSGGDPMLIKEKLRSYGSIGVIIVLFLQILAILLVIIPSPMIWFASGITYGVFAGSLICLLGINIANMISFYFVKKKGLGFISKLIPKKFTEENILAKAKKPGLLVFLVYILPGIPNGALPYLAGMTNISLIRFLVSSNLALIPMVLIYSVFGEKIISGNKNMVLILAVIICIIAIVYFVFRKRIMTIIKKI